MGPKAALTAPYAKVKDLTSRFKQRQIERKTLLNCPPPPKELAETLLNNEDVIYQILLYLVPSDRRRLQTVNRAFYLASGSFFFRHLSFLTDADINRLIKAIHDADIKQRRGGTANTQLIPFHHVRRIKSITFGWDLTQRHIQIIQRYILEEAYVLRFANLLARDVARIAPLNDYFVMLEKAFRVTHLKLPVEMVDKFVRFNPAQIVPATIITFTLFFQPTNHCWRKGFRNQPTMDRVKQFTQHAKRIRFLVAWTKLHHEDKDYGWGGHKALRRGQTRKNMLPQATDVVDLIVKLVNGTRARWELYMLADYFFRDSFPTAPPPRLSMATDIPRTVQAKLDKMDDAPVVEFKGRKEYLEEPNQHDFSRQYLWTLAKRGSAVLFAIKGLRGSWIMM